MLDLETADSVRDRDAEGARLAFEAYRARRDALDPNRPADADRILWLLQHLRRLDPALEPLALWAAESAFGNELRAHANRVAGVFALERKDFRAAGARLKSSLELLRGRDDAAERLVCLNLAAVALVEGRALEALVFSDRAARLAQEAGSDPGLFNARLATLSCLLELEDWPRFDGLMSELKAGLARIPATARPGPERRLLARAADAAAVRGDWKSALVLVEHVHAEHGAVELATRACILALGDQADAAVAERRRARRLGRSNHVVRWRLAFSRILARPDPRHAIRFVDALARAGIGSGRKADMATHIARRLGSAGAFRAARHCWGVVDDALSDQIRETTEFRARFPGLADTIRRILRDVRERLHARRREARAQLEQ